MTLGVLQAMSVIVALTLTLSMSPFAEALAGGEAAKLGEFPHAVQLSSSKTGKVFCGGSIISPNVVITAAHCVYSYWRKRKSGQNSLCFRTLSVEPSLEQDLALVTPGTLENRDWKGFKECRFGMGKTRTVDRYVIHPYFNISSLENDIALLIFGDPLNFTDNVKAIQLPPRNKAYSRGTLLGWGYAVMRSSPYLKKMEFVFKNRESCNRDPLMMIEPKERKVTDWELCTKWTKGNSSCKRDSGSSIICQGSNATTTLHNNGTNSSPSPVICGIASFIKAVGHCGESDNIGVFVEVSKYLYWIQEEAEKNVDEVKEIKMMQRLILFTSLVYLGIVIVVLVVALLVFCLYTTIKKIYLSRVTPESPV